MPKALTRTTDKICPYWSIEVVMINKNFNVLVLEYENLF